MQWILVSIITHIIFPAFLQTLTSFKQNALKKMNTLHVSSSTDRLVLFPDTKVGK